MLTQCCIILYRQHTYAIAGLNERRKNRQKRLFDRLEVLELSRPAYRTQTPSKSQSLPSVSYGRFHEDWTSFNNNTLQHTEILAHLESELYSSNQFKQVQQSRQQTLRAYWPNIHTVNLGHLTIRRRLIRLEGPLQISFLQHIYSRKLKQKRNRTHEDWLF